jgi:hypothetical protein
MDYRILAHPTAEQQARPELLREATLAALVDRAVFPEYLAEVIHLRQELKQLPMQSNQPKLFEELQVV